jgi:transcriptional regulator with XRE-family HTH domain
MLDEPTEEVEALSKHLRLCIQVQGLTLRRLESELGMGEGYLGQLLRGNVDLKVKHLFGILRALGITPADFYASMYGLVPRTSASQPGLAPLLRREPVSRYEEVRYDEVVPGISAERLDRAIFEALTRLGVQAVPPARTLDRDSSKLRERKERKQRRR